MPMYVITTRVDAARIDAVKSKLKKAFGEEANMHVVEKLTTPESRAARLEEAESIMEDAKAIVEELKDEMETWYESIPENLQGGDKASEVEECKDALDNLQGEMEGLDFSSISFPGMF